MADVKISELDYNDTPGADALLEITSDPDGTPTTESTAIGDLPFIAPGDDAADLGSGAATNGHVLTADGAGGAAWEAPTGSGGGGDVPLLSPSFTNATVYSPLPGCWQVEVAGTVNIQSGRWLVSDAAVCPYDCRITAAAAEVTTLGAASVLRPLICTATPSWEPDQIVWQDSWDSTSTGVKTTTSLAIDLTAGTRYMVILRADGATVGVRCYTSSSPAGTRPGNGNPNATTWGSLDNTVSSGVWATPLQPMKAPGDANGGTLRSGPFAGVVGFLIGATP